VSRDGYDILAIDRFSPAHQLPLKAGVGLARKIGGDIVSAWFYQGVIAHPWWLSTDADVVLPSDVLARLMGEPAEAGVACFPFEHTAGGDSAVDEATFAVEVKLRYHVLGMRYAGSPYAWHALGSCLMIHSRIYAAVRGFPKRLAGEDFYLLQKASKVGPILELPGEPMRIVARRSQRTPFGTGHEVSQLEGKVRTLKLRHPDSYTCLKHVLSSLEQAVQEPHQLRMMRWTNEMSAACASVVVALERRGAFAGWKSAMRAATTPEARRRRLHEWFDGLRSIQLLNVLESALPPLPWALALQRAPFVPGEVMLDKPPFSVLAARLRELEAIAPRMRG